MSVFDCHVNRSPVAGRIERIVYRAGKFLSADLDKASEDNERNAFVIATVAGQRLAVIQIAGLVARRIVPFAREGDAVAAGQRIGMIRFGSRVDVYLPEGTRALVAAGQTAIAGETVLADLRAAEAGRTFRVTDKGLTELSRRVAAVARSGYNCPCPRLSLIMAAHACVCRSGAFAAFRCALWCRTSSRCWRCAPA